MDGSDLLAVAWERQAQVDGVHDRLFSLAKNRASAFAQGDVELWHALESRAVGGNDT
jgi:geranylgeranyl diphosphate synthase type II